MMSNMKYCFGELNELPDEILVKILKNLNNVEVLYSFVSTSKRLDRIVRDSIFTNRLSFMKNSPLNKISSLDDSMVDRFCEEILPEIHHKIQWLDLESKSMKKILLIARYPNLRGVSLYNINVDSFAHLIQDIPVLNQISSLVMTFVVDKDKSISALDESLTDMLSHIFSQLINLEYLSFNSLISREIFSRFSFSIQRPTFVSMSLRELHITVTNFEDCLYLLNGSFVRLSTLNLTINTIYPWTRLANKEKFFSLRCLSLKVVHETAGYDDILVPFLRRISNLETIELIFKVNCNTRFIDGNVLTTDILQHMVNLRQFTFNITSSIHIVNQMHLPSSQEIQRTFENFLNDQVITWTEYILSEQIGQCIAYSHPYPYSIDVFNDITNNFPVGLLFANVTIVSLHDDRPFEHEFFVRISQSFPSLKELDITNYKPQKNKRSSKFNVITYPCLRFLYLMCSHRDYVEQFLLDTKTSLSPNISLSTTYESLETVTHRFKRSHMKLNSMKLSHLNGHFRIDSKANRIDALKLCNAYFPNAKIRLM